MKYAGVDIETIGLDPMDKVIWMISITLDGKTRVWHDCNGMRVCPPEVKKILEDDSICKIIHSSQFDCPYIEITWKIKIRNIWDSELDETVIQGLDLNIKKDTIKPGSYEEKLMKAHGTALAYVLPRYKLAKKLNKDIRNNFIDRPFGKKFIKEELDYVKEDTEQLPKLQKMQEYLLKRDGSWEVACLENKAAERYHDMKVRGIGLSPTIWTDVFHHTEKMLAQKTKSLPKEVANWNSPAQVKEYFKKKGILLPSFDDLDTVFLKTRNKTMGDFIAARAYMTAVSRYSLKWLDPEDGFLDKDGRIRADIRQIINTARNAYSNPNLQQLPGSGNTDPLRVKVIQMVTGGAHEKMKQRSAFIPAPGNVFVIGDFSGQEIGVMAAASNERLWIDALLRGDDVHGMTASLVNPAEWKEYHEKGCTFPKKCKCKGHKALREPAKINNFRLAYGGGVESFADYMGWDKVTASSYLGAHKRVIPNLTRYLEMNGAEALATGIAYSADPYRRRRVLRGEEPWQIRNQGKNTPIQSAGANMLKLALVNLPWNIPVVLVIHDEIICEVPKAQAAKAMAMLKKVMEESADYITGIKGLVRVEPKIQMNIMKDLPITTKVREMMTGNYCIEKAA